MALDRNNHPCFNDKIRHQFGRVHIPVASRCNIQCNYCNRKFDCVNESRPGVTSTILSPKQALHYLDNVTAKNPTLKVVGIAGPGDPFANPDETMESLRLVRENYPDMLLCVATNGLAVEEYADELARLNVSHVTLTINAVDPLIGEKIYSWVRYNKKVYNAREGAEILLNRQLSAVKTLNDKGITVKINSVIIPGINDEHIAEVARVTAGLGASIANCIALYKNEGTAFSNLETPDAAMIKSIRDEVGKHISQMHHCTRCRADAIGLIGEAMKDEYLNDLKSASEIKADEIGKLSVNKEKPYVAVASREGVLINQHLGEASEFSIYAKVENEIRLIETRKAPAPGSGDARWAELAEITKDCSALFVSGAGERPVNALKEHGISVLSLEGLAADALESYFRGDDIRQMTKRESSSCLSGCSGGRSGGCG